VLTVHCLLSLSVVVIGSQLSGVVGVSCRSLFLFVGIPSSDSEEHDKVFKKPTNALQPQNIYMEVS
jgi:hypothetical protein